MGKGLKSTVTLTGGICLCVLIISVSGRIGSDSYAEKPAEADNRFKNGNTMEKTLVSGKEQKSADIPDTDIWGAEYITEIDLSNDMDQSRIKDDSSKEWNNSSIENEDKENPDMDVSLQELEKILKSNLLEDITFQESERAIFYYRVRMKQFFDGYVILVYKETVEKDIVYVGPLGIEKETGNMYQLKDGEYVLVKTGVMKGFALPDIPQDEFWVEWEADSDDEDYKLSEEVYTAVFDCLKENGVENIKLMDMGIYTFLGKRYYWLKLFDENDVQIFTLQHYCIDMENGNLYEVSDDFGATYMSLYYMGNVYSHCNDSILSPAVLWE